MAHFPMPTTADPERDLYPWDLRDPGGFLTHLGRLLPLGPGTIVALVHLPSTRQELLAAVRVDWSDDPPRDRLDADLDRSARSDLLHDLAHELWGDRPDTPGRPDHAFVTVVVRPGRVVFGPPEYRALTAWRYANYFLPVHQGDLLLVTPHGWRAFSDDSGGSTPAMAAEASWKA